MHGPWLYELRKGRVKTILKWFGIDLDGGIGLVLMVLECHWAPLRERSGLRTIKTISIFEFREMFAGILLYAIECLGSADGCGQA